MAIGYYYTTTNVEGSADDDFIFGSPYPRTGTSNVLHGNGGDDLIMGDGPNFWIPNPDNVFNSTLRDALDIDNSNSWSTAENPLVGDTTVPYTSIYATMSAGQTDFYKVTVGSGQTITIDVDFASYDTLGVDARPIVVLTDSSGGTRYGGSPNYSSITQGGLGSLPSGGPFGPDNSFDPYQSYTNTTGVAQTIYIGVWSYVGNVKQTFSGGEAFVVNVSVTGHAATSPVATGGDTIDGGTGDDLLFGVGGGDFITGGDGNDYISAGSGSDTVDGGNGNDQIWSGRPLSAGSPDGDLISGGSGDDRITAESGGRFYGDAGDDVMRSAGLGELYGGADDDVVYDAVGTDELLDGGDGTDTVVLRDGGFTADLATGATALAGVIARNFENARGGGGADTITGTDLANLLDGGAGDDTLNGGGGADTLTGGVGYDTLNGDGGDDTIVDSTGTFDGGDGFDTLKVPTTLSVGVLIDQATSSIFAGDALSAPAIGHFTNVERIVASQSNDRVIASLGNDVVDGGGGTDQLVYWNATAGVTVDLRVTTAQDTIGAGIDTITGFKQLWGSEHGDVLTGGGLADKLLGFDGDDTLIATTSQYLYGLNGDDLFIVASGGGPVVDGGAGHDTISFAGAANGVTLDFGAGRATVGAATLTLSDLEGAIGSAFNDTLTAGPGAGSVREVGYGETRSTLATAIDLNAEFTSIPVRADAPTGTPPHARAIAATNGGADWYKVSVPTAGQIVLETSNAYFNTVLTLFDRTGAVLATNDNASSTTFNSQIVFTAPAGTYYIKVTQAGTPDATTAHGFYTLDVAVPGHAASSARTGSELSGGDGDDTLSGNTSADLLDGGAGADRLTGAGGNDVLTGGAGPDRLNGGGGTDTASYAAETGSVHITLLDGGARTVGHGAGAAGDVLIGIENLTGGGVADVLTGNGGANRLVGGGGVDVLSGLGGDDTLIGGGGRDQLTGGTGADRFVFDSGETARTAAQADTITDFRQNDHDRIDLSAFDADTRTAGVQPFTFIGAAAFSRHAGELNATIGGGMTVVRGDTDGDGRADFAIVLMGNVTLAAGDFQLGLAASPAPAEVVVGDHLWFRAEPFHLTPTGLHCCLV